jgi:hypothetical protein
MIEVAGRVVTFFGAKSVDENMVCAACMITGRNNEMINLIANYFL